MASLLRRRCLSLYCVCCILYILGCQSSLPQHSSAPLCLLCPSDALRTAVLLGTRSWRNSDEVRVEHRRGPGGPIFTPLQVTPAPTPVCRRRPALPPDRSLDVALHWWVLRGTCHLSPTSTPNLMPSCVWYHRWQRNAVRQLMWQGLQCSAPVDMHLARRLIATNTTDSSSCRSFS